MNRTDLPVAIGAAQPSIPRVPDDDLAVRNGWRQLADATADLPASFADILKAWGDALERSAAHWPSLCAALLVAVALMAAASGWAGPAFRRFAQRRWAGQALRHSMPGIVGVGVQTLAAWLAMSLLFQVFAWAARPDPVVLASARAVLIVVVLAILVTALGRGLLRLWSARHPTLFDPEPLRPVPYLCAGALAFVALVDHHALLAGRTAEPTPLSALAASVCLLAVMGVALLRVAAALRDSAPQDVQEQRRLHLARGLLTLGWMLAAATVACVLAGHLALAAFLMKQAAWSALVLALLYLCGRVIRDATDLVVEQRQRLLLGSRRLGISTRRLQQAVIVAGGAGVLALACLAVMLITAPYGLGPADVLGRVFDSGGRLRVGDLSFSPWQIVRAILVLGVVVLLGRLLARWLACRLLPTTRLDSSVQASLTTLVSYAGVVLGIGLGLAALGVEPNRITWVVSALTVGIGFGLQAIVQNFISGLILLVERPVKVGDWVVVGDAEGDVRRINVRATEIALPDRTTVLVPNSELITKVVRNRTFAAGDGLVKIVVPVSATADVERVTGIARTVAQGHRELKSAPAPLVQVEDVKDNKIWLGVSGYVDGPRQVNRIRAELLYALLRRLQAEGIPLT